MTRRGSREDSNHAALIEERQGADATPNGVVVSRVIDLDALLAARPLRPHEDVIDALTDVVVAILDAETASVPTTGDVVDVPMDAGTAGTSNSSRR